MGPITGPDYPSWRGGSRGRMTEADRKAYFGCGVLTLMGSVALAVVLVLLMLAVRFVGHAWGCQ